jgi:hypothetical protein
MRSRLRDFAVGTALPLPMFFVLGLLVWFVFYRDAPTDPKLTLLFIGIVTTVAVQIALAVRFWKSARWRAYGVLASFVVAVCLGGGFAVFLLYAIGSAIKG